MLNKLLRKKSAIYVLAVIAILIESFSSVLLKFAGRYPFLSSHYVLYYIAAIFVMGIYAVLWQLLLEHLPLTTAYLRKGLSYILVYVWAYLIFGEKISLMQWIGTSIILAGMIVSQIDETQEDIK